jgi:riboflavin synthase
MFTGIIEATGAINKLEKVDLEWRLHIDAGNLSLEDTSIGDSIAVNGCCLTVTSLSTKHFSADVSNETMSCTSLGNLKTGARVNLEKAMLASSRFGGHIVSGHVDCVGILISSTADGQSVKLEFDAPVGISKYIADKGSICIDGTSLTVNTVNKNKFSINIIPHTQQETIIGNYVVGQVVNLEVDLVARYLERLMAGNHEQHDSTKTISSSFLEEHGFKIAK